MKVVRLATLALLCVAALSCSEASVTPAPCPADGRTVQVFFTSAGGDSMSDTGRFVGWNQHWVSLEHPSGRVIHLAADTVTSIQEIGN